MSAKQVGTLSKGNIVKGKKVSHIHLEKNDNGTFACTVYFQDGSEEYFQDSRTYVTIMKK